MPDKFVVFAQQLLHCVLGCRHVTAAMEQVLDQVCVDCQVVGVECASPSRCVVVRAEKDVDLAQVLDVDVRFLLEGMRRQDCDFITLIYGLLLERNANVSDAIVVCPLFYAS